MSEENKQTQAAANEETQQAAETAEMTEAAAETAETAEMTETAAETAEASAPAEPADAGQTETGAAASGNEETPVPEYLLVIEPFALECTALREGETVCTYSEQLAAGDVICLREDGIEISGRRLTPPADQTDAEAQYQTAVKESETLRKNTEAVDAAFYQNVCSSEQNADTGAEMADETKAAAAAEEEPSAAEKKQDAQAETYSVRQLLDDALDLVESVITSVFVVMLIFTFVFCVATVDGDSMVPTLSNNDRLMVNRIGRTYETGDILILDSQTACVENSTTGEFYETDGLGKRIVKRLIAQEGDVVNIDFSQGIVYVNGEALDEPYTNTLTTRDNGAFTYPLTVPEGYVFVLGDNRNISKDSRHPQVGMVPVSDIIGKVVLRLTPFSEFGFID